MYRVGAKIDKPNLKGAQSLDELADRMEAFLEMLSQQLNEELQKISHSGPGSIADQVARSYVFGEVTKHRIAQTVQMLVTGGIDFRVDSVAITTGGTTITFATALKDATFIVLRDCYDSSGRQIPVTIASKTPSSFLATPLRNATLDYLAIPYVA